MVIPTFQTPKANGKMKNMSDLQTLLDLQKILMYRLLGMPEDVAEKHEFYKEQMFQGCLIWLLDEVKETLEVALGVKNISKPWKDSDIEDQREELLEEMVDILFFVLEMFNLAGLDANEIKGRYMGKYYKNIGRAAKVGADQAVVKDVKVLAMELMNENGFFDPSHEQSSE